MSKLERYHEVWLAAHPYRTEEWLRAQLKAGFDVHHIDCNHENNVADNLVLIEHGDHMWLHKGPRRLRQITSKGKKYRSKLTMAVPVRQEPEVIAQRMPKPVREPDGVWVTCANTWKVFIRDTDDPDQALARVAEFSA